MNCKVCGNTSAKNSSTSFFRFPKDNSKCKDWAERCGLLALFEKHGTQRFYKSFRICSQHFHPKDVVFDGRKKRLLQSATPYPSVATVCPSVQKDSKALQLPQDLCRLCAQQDENLTEIFGSRGKLLDLERKLKFIPQEINKYDILPLKVCNTCVSKVNQFYNFIMECIKAETKLKAMLYLEDCNKPVVEKLDWDSGMEASLNETPKINHSSDSITCFPETPMQHYYSQILQDDFICDDPEYLSRVVEADIIPSVHLHDTNILHEVDFRIISFDHDYSNAVLRDQLQSDGEIQTPQDQRLTEDSNVRLESSRSSEALSAHSETNSGKWDLNRGSSSEFYDEAICCRFHRKKPEETPLQWKEHSPSEICDRKFHKVAFSDEHSFAPLSRDSCASAEDLRPCCKEKARLKQFLKCDDTKSSLILELSESHSKLQGRGSRPWGILKTQTGESHRCSECGKFLRSKASLRQHRSVHSDKRVHCCRECGMSFKRKDTLCNHVRIHTGERPFVCKVCGFAFKQRGDCIKHEKNHGRSRELESKGV